MSSPGLWDSLPRSVAMNLNLRKLVLTADECYHSHLPSYCHAWAVFYHSMAKHSKEIMTNGDWRITTHSVLNAKIIRGTIGSRAQITRTASVAAKLYM
jgi:phage terminase small subunit